MSSASTVLIILTTRGTEPGARALAFVHSREAAARFPSSPPLLTRLLPVRTLVYMNDGHVALGHESAYLPPSSIPRSHPCFLITRISFASHRCFTT
ncbi:hypothetical protein K466DRAFT_279692 [Polyporus arcularius HHB13444]|uniref:Uncharacterized protein n=1 Tax=Polyporus arcularius HHB13444 TaxID=1314778 RepID=A0A5C3PAV4_9APHY|nr:hypothetical protein K466DRAFT_279692 [Polyporus arcularius HHB13444]